MKNTTLLLVLALAIGVAQPAQAGKKLLVSGLSWDTTASEVDDLTAPFGLVLDIEVTYFEDRTGQSASAEILYEDPVAADGAVIDYNNQISETTVGNNATYIGINVLKDNIMF